MKKTATYIIWAPSYTKSNGVRALYTLCKELNKRGLRAFIFADESHITLEGVSYISKITKQMKRQDIVIYPEVISGNPLEFDKVVRWVLYYPGQMKDGDKEFDKNEVKFTWIKDYYEAPVLQVQHLNQDLFFEDKSVEKDIVAYFVHKGGQCRDLPELKNAVKITMDYPSTREELAKLLQRTKVLYSFDNKTALNDEALLCGAQVKIVTQDGIIDHTQMEEVSSADAEKQILNFIKITQNNKSWKKRLIPRWIFYKNHTAKYIKYRLFGFKFSIKR